ncbi:hypothetical protein IKG49_01290 [Candidatus Saccharibacteria bacterium]|nr:hypothetical protein [Candidatus Saccharibacteria bacterium]
MIDSQKKNKPIVVGCLIAAVLALIIVILIVLFNNNTIPGRIDQSFFTPNDNKYVITVTGSDIFPEADKEYTPIKIHRVYTTANNSVNGLKIYQEYENNKIAKLAYEQIEELDRNIYEAIDLDGPYVILTAKPIEYEDITVRDLKNQTEAEEQTND